MQIQLNDSSPIVNFPIADIKITPERQRKQAAPDDMLIESIRTSGLLQPIIIKEDGTLIAGERRYLAHRQLGRETILARIFEKLSPVNAFLVELHENLARKQLTWQEETKAVGSFHNLQAVAKKGWLIKETAELIGLSQTKTGQYLAIHKEAQIDEEIYRCGTMQAAVNYLENKALRNIAAATSRGLLAEKVIRAVHGDPSLTTAALLSSIQNKTLAQLGDETMPSILEQGKLAETLLQNAKKEQQPVTNLGKNEAICANFTDWAAGYTGPSFDVIHCDFPYGKNYTGSNTSPAAILQKNEVYADTADIFKNLLFAFLLQQDRFVAPIAHCLFWFDMSYYSYTIAQFEAAGWTTVQPFPLIWTKGYSGVAADTKRRPRHCYETALLFSRGDRKIVKLTNDHFSCNSKEENLHTSQKPVPMLEHFLQLLIDEHTNFLDPTCGSGSSLVAARKLNAASFLGIELEQTNADIANFLLQKKAA
jgi:ParB/RepB/Spo0J family partition protein